MEGEGEEEQGESREGKKMKRKMLVLCHSYSLIQGDNDEIQER